MKLVPLAFLLATVVPLTAGAADDPIVSVLEKSQAETKGVMIYANGSQIGGGVTALTATHVTLRSQQYGTIVVRLDRIDGVAAP